MPLYTPVPLSDCFCVFPPGPCGVDGLACVGFCLGLSLQWALWALSAPPKHPAGYTGVYRGQVDMYVASSTYTRRSGVFL